MTAPIDKELEDFIYKYCGPEQPVGSEFEKLRYMEIRAIEAASKFERERMAGLSQLIVDALADSASSMRAINSRGDANLDIEIEMCESALKKIRDLKY